MEFDLSPGTDIACIFPEENKAGARRHCRVRKSENREDDMRARPRRRRKARPVAGIGIA
ncbi:MULTISPECIES: hypothetical protein [Cupriavidus]